MSGLSLPSAVTDVLRPLAEPGSVRAPAAPEGPGIDVLGRLVRLSFLMRLGALVCAVGYLVGEQLTVRLFIAIMLLAGTSFVALSREDALDLVVRHPMLAMADLLVVIGVFFLLGVDSPLAIGALSTAFLTGVLFPLRVTVVLGATLLTGYAGAAAQSAQDGQRLGFLLAAGMPVVFVCLAFIGQSFRRIHQAQVRAEQQLAEFVQASATAEERARMARELHDSLAKSLQGIAFGARALPTWVERDGERARSEAEAIARGADQAVRETRTLLARMRADDPARRFDVVLADVVRAWGDQHGRAVEFVAGPPLEPGADVRYELLAAVREALENVQRHAPHATVRVRCEVAEGAAVVIVEDDGPGFDPARRPAFEGAGHFGLRGMEERMALVGGRMTVTSRPGAGTAVQLAVPLAARSAR